MFVDAAKVGAAEPHLVVAAADVSSVLLHGGSRGQVAALERWGARVKPID